MAREVAIGGEALCVINGVDYEIDDANLNNDETDIDITCTSSFEPVERVTWGEDLTTGRRLTGDVSFKCDRNNFVFDNLTPGHEYTMILTFFSGKTVTGVFKVNWGWKMGGITGAQSIAMTIKSQRNTVVFS